MSAPLIVQLTQAWTAPTWVRRTVLLVAGVAFLALLAQVRIPVGPVPVTGQTFGVLLLGMAYGARGGALTTLAYVLLGAAGAPIFTAFSAGLAGVTAGYLLAFPIAAYLVGRLAERGFDRSPVRTALAMLVGTAVIYAGGLAWLRTLAPDWGTTLAWGLTPFLLGDALKVGLAAWVLPSLTSLVGRR
jgi:biotin transport system substrate-specific component